MERFTTLTEGRKSGKALVVLGAFAALAAFSALAAGTSLPAAAATPASFTLTAGALSISAPTASVSLGSEVASALATTMSGQLGSVTVTDQRGGTTTWTASVISTAFTPTAGLAGTIIAANTRRTIQMRRTFAQATEWVMVAV
jgi:hypothetical protein